MKKWFVIAVMLVVVAAAAFVVRSGMMGASVGQGLTVAAAEAEPVISPREVIAEGKVVPARYSALSMPVSGIVDEILVSEDAISSVREPARNSSRWACADSRAASASAVAARSRPFCT